MKKSLQCFAFFLCLIAATQTRLLPESMNGNINVSLPCVLFGGPGCNIECALTSQLYDYESYGVCVLGRICHCKKFNNQPVHFYDVWKTKFDADYVYNQILENNSKLIEAARILSDPIATTDEYKKLLKPMLSPYEYSKLKSTDNTLADKFIKDDKVNRKSIQKYINEQLDTVLKQSYNKPLLSKNYQENFTMALKTYVGDYGTLYNFAYKVSRLQNKKLERILQQFLNDNDIDKPAVNLDEKPSVSEVLHYTITNELIKRIDAIAARTKV